MIKAGYWAGIQIEIDKIRKFLWCKDKKELDMSIINARRFDTHRKKFITFKVEKIMWTIKS